METRPQIVKAVKTDPATNTVPQSKVSNSYGYYCLHRNIPLLCLLTLKEIGPLKKDKIVDKVISPVTSFYLKN